MNKNLLSIFVINCILFSMLSGFGIAKNTSNFENEVDNNNFVLLNQLSTQSNINPQYQDGRYLKKLEWYSPHGEQPGTYEDYLRQLQMIKKMGYMVVNAQAASSLTEDMAKIMTYTDEETKRLRPYPTLKPETMEKMVKAYQDVRGE